MGRRTIQKQTLSSQVADEIRQRILNNEYGDGMQLRQEHLATEMGISRIPVREALHQLHSEGFVTLVSHKGAVVSEMSVDEMTEMFELRARVETWLLELAIPRMDDADLAALAASAELYAREKQEPEQLSDANWHFHALLYAPSRRVFTIDMVAKLHRQLDRYTRLMVSLESGVDRAAREHIKLVKLCKAGDKAGAVTLLHAHIMSGGNLLAERIPALRAGAG